MLMRQGRETDTLRRKKAQTWITGQLTASHLLLHHLRIPQRSSRLDVHPRLHKCLPRFVMLLVRINHPWLLRLLTSLSTFWRIIFNLISFLISLSFTSRWRCSISIRSSCRVAVAIAGCAMTTEVGWLRVLTQEVSLRGTCPRSDNRVTMSIDCDAACCIGRVDGLRNAWGTREDCGWPRRGGAGARSTFALSSGTSQTSIDVG